MRGIGSKNRVKNLSFFDFGGNLGRGIVGHKLRYVRPALDLKSEMTKQII